MVMKVLFVCTGNMDRSPTAKELLKDKEGFDAKSAGTWIYANTRISKELIDWADVVFAMEEKHKEFILTIRPEDEEKVIVLDILDKRAHFLQANRSVTQCELPFQSPSTNT